MKLTKKQAEFLENLEHWETRYPNETEETMTFEFICVDHDGDYDTLQEFTAKSFKDLAEQVIISAENFDPEEETLLWVNEVGLGNKGVPKKLRDLLDEFDAYKSELEDLALQFEEFSNLPKTKKINGLDRKSKKFLSQKPVSYF